MTDVSEGPTEPTADTPGGADLDLLEGFEEAHAAIGNPSGPPGPPEPTEAVETSEAEETPAPDPAETAETAPAESEAEESEAEQTVNFDGFSDDQRTTWERLHKAGAVTEEEIERARKESMFQSNYTKKTMSLADQRKAWESEVEDRTDDLRRLDLIRSDDRRHAAFVRASEMDEPQDDESQDELVDKKGAAELAAETYRKMRAAEDAESQKEQEAYAVKEEAVRVAVQESIKTLGIDAKVMQSYLQAEEAMLPPGVHPIRDLTPEDIQDRIAKRHELMTTKAEVAALKKKLAQRTSHDERTAKQSLPPAKRVVDDGEMNPLQKTEAELGVDSDWGNVTGFGHRVN